MTTTVVSQGSLFWNKLGKWQMLAVLLTLVVFFVALGMGNKETAGTISALTLAAVTLTVLTVAALVLAVPSAVPFVFLFAAATASIAFAFVKGVAIIPGIAFAVAEGIAVTLAVAEVKKYGIRKRIVWFSFAAEFACIVLPMSLA
ncbi:hypothetical protein KKH39_01605 [Patescibacteria group bacterium]|nr:hypothetical protein [Patescibacteria group bacterium]